MSRLLRDIPAEKQIAKHVQWFERRREETLRQISPAKTPQLGPYLSISRELGSDGNKLAGGLAEKLGWQLFDREIIEAIAGKTHVREELVAQFDEHVRSAFDTYLQNLYTGSVFDGSKYLYHLSQVLLGLAQYGRVVILGRAANLILPADRGLRVRVVAPREVRVKNLMHEQSLAEKEARQFIAAHDQEQRTFFQRYFQSRPDDPGAYDLIINTGEIGLEPAEALLLQLLSAKQLKK